MNSELFFEASIVQLEENNDKFAHKIDELKDAQETYEQMAKNYKLDIESYERLIKKNECVIALLRKMEGSNEIMACEDDTISS